MKKLFKKNQIVKHKWEAYKDWTCFSKITFVDKNGIGFSNILNVSKGNKKPFNLDENFIDFGVERFLNMEFEIIGEIITEEDQIKLIMPEYFL